jgi:PAS domain S-box-containing protein
MAERDASLRSILHAAAQVLSCHSVHLARVTEDRQSLVLAVAVHKRAEPQLQAVESALGFQVSGLTVRLEWTGSILVRAFREQRLMVTRDVTEFAGNHLPQDIMRAVGDLIGPRSFAVVPVSGRGGALGVLLVERADERGFSSEERDLLLMYADRVGAELDSEALSDEASRLLCAVEDLGDSERLRREVLVAREHLAKVMRAISDAILTLDEGGVIVRANDASRTVLGLSPEQLCGRSAFSLAATQKGHDRLLSLQDHLRQNGFAERQLRLTRSHPDHPEAAALSFPAHLSALLLCDEHHRPIGAVWRIQDLSQRRRDAAERRRLRKKLLQSERLSALGEMAARIAHEVRNPLVSIGAAAQVVAEELPPGSPLLSEVRAISSEVRRLDGIISDFLDFSRARPRRHEPAQADADEVLREVVERVLAKAGGLPIQVASPGSVWARIHPDGLRQVLWNVLLNACEAVAGADGAGGRSSGSGEGQRLNSVPIECTVRRREPLPGRAGRVTIAVADRGPGIPPALRRRVFDPFFSTKARGTGLGLAICKQIVEDHGGRVRLFGRSGGGTRVVIELRPAPALERLPS